jgi:hypothetical protein
MDRAGHRLITGQRMDFGQSWQFMPQITIFKQLLVYYRAHGKACASASKHELLMARSRHVLLLQQPAEALRLT